MDLSWINVADTSVKIGLGALISAISGYIVFMKTQSHNERKEEKVHFYKLQEEKKLKYVDFLVQSQELIQSHLYSACTPDSEPYKSYLRAFNEVQIISNDDIRSIAYNVSHDVQSFIFLNKNQQEISLLDGMAQAAREKVAAFQKLAQVEVTKQYSKT